MGRTASIDYSNVPNMVAEGRTTVEIAKALSCSVASATNYLRRHGLKARHPKAGPKARTEKMALMYSQGCTLERIGAHFEITRERVRQILSGAGVGRGDGGQTIKASQRKAAKQAKKDARWLALYGLTLAEVRPYQKSGLTTAYRQQQKTAQSRGVSFSLSFRQWVSIWETSGKLHLRGKGKDHYCMSRIVDTGGYELGNVHIQLTTDNSREAVKKWRGKTKVNKGVFNLYPGRSHPWWAKVGKTSIGFFATEEEAVAARKAFALKTGARIGPHLGSGKGWTLQKRCTSKPYLMQAAGIKKSFATIAEAEEAYRETVAAILAARQSAPAQVKALIASDCLGQAAQCGSVSVEPCVVHGSHFFAPL